MKPFRLPGDGRTVAQGTQQGNFGGISSSFSWRKKIAFLLEINYLKCIFIFTGKSGTLPRKWAQSKQCDIAKNIILIMSFRYYIFKMPLNKARTQFLLLKGGDPRNFMFTISSIVISVILALFM